MKKPLILLFVMLASCSSPNADIRTEYSRVARQVGVVPVYPPTESVQVGDIYAMSLGKNPADVIIEWAGEAPEVAGEAERFMSRRIVFRETATGSNALAINRPTQTDTYGSGLTRRSELIIESLPLEAFPSVTASAGFAFGAARNTPGQALGLGFGSQTQVTIDYTDVRSYGLPKVAAARQLDLQDKVLDARFDPPSSGNEGWTVDEALRLEWSNLQRAGLSPTPLAERCVQTLVVTRVFLTRQILYTFSDAQITALSRARASEGATATPAPDVPSVDVVINNSGEFDSSAVEAAVDTLATNVAASVSQTGSSRGVTFEGFTALGAQFKQVFQRPVVIGWEGWPVRSERTVFPADFDSRSEEEKRTLISEAQKNQQEEFQRCEEQLSIR